jgi:DNA polymerase I
MILEEKQKPKYRTYEDFPPEELYLYAGLDCIATSTLFEKLHPRLIEEPEYLSVSKGRSKKVKLMSVEESMNRYAMPAHEFILDMEINGIKYDVARNVTIGAQMVEEMNVLEDKIFSAIGKKLDLNSGKAMAEYLYGELGLVAPYTTKTGEPATDGDALKELAKTTNFPWLSNIGKRNDIASVYRTFVENYVADFVKRDGRVHPSYNQHGTSSFRISGDSPNLTQLPRPKHGYNLRECYTVEKGNAFLALDFRSMEVKVAGALSKDPKLLQAIWEGLDFHSFSASEMYGIPYKEFVGVLEDESHPLYRDYKEKRQVSKVLTFSILYGSTPRGIAFQLGITEEKAIQLTNLYFKAYPLLEVYIQDSHEMAESNHLVVSPFGQRKWEFGTKKEYKYTAVYNACKRNSANVRIQNTASSIGLFCFSALNEEIKKFGGKSICTVYDSLEMEIPIEHIAKAINLSYYYMNEYPQKCFNWLDFPIGADGELGYNWGELHSVKPGITQKEALALLA